MKFPQALQDALNRHLPLFWRSDNQNLELRAVTSRAENGTERTAKVATRINLEGVYDLSELIFQAGGAVNVDLFEAETNIWDYGWNPDMYQRRNELRKLWRQAQFRTRPQPQW